MNFATKIALGTWILGTLSWAQNPSDPPSPPPSTAMISSAPAANSSDSAIKPSSVEVEPTPDTDIVVDPASLLPGLQPVPSAKATLIGGTIERLDRVRDQLTVRVFGGGRMNILFDPRTHVYQGKADASIASLQPGQRVYLDTILDGNTVFARSIRLKATQAVGESQGVVISYRAGRDLLLRDSISPTPIRVHLSSSTQFIQGTRTVGAGAVIEGSLVTIKFSSEGNGHDVAREISILAQPGTRYMFTGQVVHLDLRTGLLVLNSSTDNKTYEIYLETSRAPDDNLHVGSIVTISTDFDGSRYTARSLAITSQNQ